MVHACCAYGCKNVFKKGRGLGFFRFPKNKHRRIQWAIALRRKDFVPSNSARICGEHFQTGRPSRDIDHPDYVPNIFAFNDEDFDYEEDQMKKRSKLFKKKLVDDIREFPFLNVEERAVSSEETDDQLQTEKETTDFNSSSSDEYEEFQTEAGSINQLLPVPQFTAIKKSPLVPLETVKMILEKDAKRNQDTVFDPFVIYGKNRIPPTLFTFIDLDGKIIARYVEKRLRKNACLEKKKRKLYHVFTSSQIVPTVQVIVDKERAKTAYVDMNEVINEDLPSASAIPEEMEDPSEMNDYETLFPDTIFCEEPGIKQEIEEVYRGDETNLKQDDEVIYCEDSDIKHENDLETLFIDLRTLDDDDGGDLVKKIEELLQNSS